MEKKENMDNKKFDISKLSVNELNELLKRLELKENERNHNEELEEIKKATDERILILAKNLDKNFNTKKAKDSWLNDLILRLINTKNPEYVFKYKTKYVSDDYIGNIKEYLKIKDGIGDITDNNKDYLLEISKLFLVFVPEKSKERFCISGKAPKKYMPLLKLHQLLTE